MTKCSVNLNLTKEAKMDLSWQTYRIKISRWCPLLPYPRYNHQVKFIQHKLGTYQGEIWTRGMLLKKESFNHINYLKLLSAFLTLQCFTKQKCNITIWLKMDNLTVLPYTNRIGRTHLQVLAVQPSHFIVGLESVANIPYSWKVWQGKVWWGKVWRIWWIVHDSSN